MVAKTQPKNKLEKIITCNGSCMPTKPEFPCLLLPGFHEFQIVDIVAKFVTPFTTSTRRALLAKGLIEFIQDARYLSVTGDLWFDGSFITEKIDPDDVDVVLIIDASWLSAVGASTQQKLATLLNQPRVRAKYNLDVCASPSDDVNMVSYWRGWYGFKRDGKSAKGIGFVKL